MSAFNPDDVGQKGSLFGFPYTEEQADLVIIPVPWDVTTSYQDGTARAPELIRQESTQLDFSLLEIPQAHTYPIHLEANDVTLYDLSKSTRKLASQVINELENGSDPDEDDLRRVNEACKEMTESIGRRSRKLLDQGKVVATLGGDHSTPLGLIEELAKRHSDFGILQIDAHMDLREAYEGFEYSHASIMYNALKLPSVSRLVQVGIRDYSEGEKKWAQGQKERISVFWDEELQKSRWSGTPWPKQADQIIQNLPEHVYISFDLDGLEPNLCPHTGTPVPGGLTFYESVHLIESVVRSGRKIIGFDLSECGPATWDANVASRVLYRLTSAVGVSRGFLSIV